MKRIVSSIVVLAAVWYAAVGQDEVWSLDRCIGHAMEHNSGILLEEALVGSSREQLKYSKMALLPTLHLYVNQYFNWGRSVDMQELVIVRNRLTQQTSGSIGASFSIFDGFARINTIKANRAMVDAAQGDAALAAVKLEADITRTYLAYILANLTCERLRKRAEIIKLQTERLRCEAESGARDYSDLLELESKAADIEAQIADATGEMDYQLLLLKNLIGYDAAIIPDTGLIAEAAIPIVDWETTDFEYVPPVAIMSEAGRVKAAGYSLKAARGAFMPSLSLSAAYGTYYSDAASTPFKEQVDGNRNPSLSLSLVIPIFDGGNAAAAMARARSELEAEQLKLRQARENAKSEFMQMRQQAATLASQIKVCQAKCRVCRERMRTATARYDCGEISTSSWAEAFEDLSQSECALLQCQCKYLFQIRIIDYYKKLAAALVSCQQEEGYWTRSLLDPKQAPGRETSGTALNCYGLLWGINNGILPKAYIPAAEKAWEYLATIALQPNNTVGYVQPIGEKAIPGQVVDQESVTNFGTGAFLLAACEYYRFISK